MCKNKKSYTELRAISEYCFLFPQLSTMNEEFVGEFMFNHEAVASQLHPQENRAERSNRTIQIMEDANILASLLSLGDMTTSQINERLNIGRERIEQALESLTISRRISSYMDDKIRYLTLA